MLIVRRRLRNLHRFLMLPTTEAGQTLPLIYTLFLIHDHHTAPCSDGVFLHCIVAMPANLQRLCETS